METSPRKGVDYPGITITFYCHNGHGSFLMQKRSTNCRDEHGKWDIGSGSLDFGDSVEDTLRKEIREEYCTEVLAFEFLGYRDIFREHEGQKTHWVSLSFRVLVDPKTVANGEPHKFDAIDWFTTENMPPVEELHSQVPNFFECYGARL